MAAEKERVAVAVAKITEKKSNFPQMVQMVQMAKFTQNISYIIADITIDLDLFKFYYKIAL